MVPRINDQMYQHQYNSMHTIQEEVPQNADPEREADFDKAY